MRPVKLSYTKFQTASQEVQMTSIIRILVVTLPHHSLNTRKNRHKIKKLRLILEISRI